MLRVLKSKLMFLGAVALCSIASACVQPEPLRTVTDTYCLNSKRLTAEPAPGVGVDDPGNRFDTDETFEQIVGHNEVYDRLCYPALGPSTTSP